MLRTIVTVSLLVALAGAAQAQLAFQGVDPNLLSRLLQKYKSEPRTFEFGMIGDQQYGAEGERKFPALTNSMNRARLEFVTHNGDFKNGSSVCSNAVFQNRLESFEAFEHPFILTPGDNDWTDCHRANNGAYDPLERLAMIRRMFYPNNFTLGKRKMEVVRQSDDPRFSLYRENAIWAVGNVVFASVHVIGSNNNWGRTPEQDMEYTARNLANLYWLRTAFAFARDGNFDGVFIVMQADMNWELPATAYDRLGFNDTIVVLSQEVQAFKKPVLLTNGDTHYLKIDKELRGLRSGRRLENFTRVQNFSDLDAHWLKVRVEPNNPNLFVVEQAIVPENVFVHP
jgi:hypothetical protein